MNESLTDLPKRGDQKILNCFPPDFGSPRFAQEHFALFLFVIVFGIDLVRQASAKRTLRKIS